MANIRLFLYIVLIVVLAFLVFYSGFLLGQKSSATEQEMDYSYFSELSGFGKIESIAADGSTITIVSQTGAGVFEINTTLTSKTKFFKTAIEENEEITGEPINLSDLTIGENVYYVIHPTGDSSFDLIWLNIQK